ncbi:MAG: hypothetical protein Athens101428_535 [Candidatus Berkelbacteria bacterium Athens1014_28]|uniref:Uncharacterized protein n=1 Tax=Candidatus Berkelbacteria bacterium Athens1014_28 TaxID=2017145 RepID=A0A554LLQ2_9BACT|nr:MAG: hypothetical protein Athens101428_535 [Candidatus Berkelbacteria bacterium Athens1014_28]
MSTDIVATLKAKAKINFFRATSKDNIVLRKNIKPRNVNIGKNCEVAQTPAFFTRYK